VADGRLRRTDRLSRQDYERGYKEAGSQTSHPASAGAAVIVGVATVVGATPGPKPISILLVFVVECERLPSCTIDGRRLEGNFGLRGQSEVGLLL
jgi:hypothetical protein